MKKSILLCLAICVITSAQSQIFQPTCYPFPKTITVSGSSEMYVVPDEIYVEVGLREYKRKGEEKIKLENIKTDFLNKCSKAGIADSLVTIVSYGGENMNPLYWKKRKKDPDLYGEITYQVKFNNSKKMDELVELLDDDATTRFQIVRVWHSKMQEFRKQLKIDAVKAAKNKGIYLTEAINEKLGEAITIDEPEENDINTNSFKGFSSNAISNTAYFNWDKDGANMSSDSGESSVDFKQIKLRFNVTVIFALK